MQKDRIEKLRQRLLNAIQMSGRSPKDVRVIAVAKNKTEKQIREAYNFGFCEFGENYVQEAIPKIAKLIDLHVKWHFVGHLQSNKVKLTANHFEFIHSVDSLKIASEINKVAQARQKILIQVNLSAEESKGGVAPKQLAQILDEIQHFPNIQLCGLMFMPPLNLDEYQQLSYFEKANLLKTRHSDRVSHPHSLIELSMGTSHDFEVAIRMGATMIRLGTIIFGDRVYE